MAKVKFSDIHVGAFVMFNECYAVKLNKTTLFYRKDDRDEIQEFKEQEEIEIEDDNDNSKS